jgi:hypothetical protein
MNEDDPDQSAQFCEWFQHKVHEDEFVSKIVWSDEATFKLNDTVNHCNCVFWAPEGSHIHVDEAANLPELTVWCGLSHRVLIGLFFFEGTVTGPVYLTILQTSILPAICQLYGIEPF